MIGIDLDHTKDRIIHIQCRRCGRPATPDSSGKVNYLDNGLNQSPVCPSCFEKWIMKECVWSKDTLSQKEHSS